MEKEECQRDESMMSKVVRGIGTYAADFGGGGRGRVLSPCPRSWNVIKGMPPRSERV